jgi:hypothetical protein
VVVVVTSYAGPPLVADVGSINAEGQASVTQHKELLLDSKWTIAQSRRLLERTRGSRAS